MRKDAPFIVGETYHLFNRGAHKQPIFTCGGDYERFLMLLYLANNQAPIVIRDILQRHRGQTSVIFEQEQSPSSLVGLRAYCLMPNHYHLLIQEKMPGGITRYMRKVLTGYSMYFNTLYDHSGILSQGAFKSKHVSTENYFRYIYSYIHLNPLGLSHPDWETKGISSPDSVRQALETYPYSSFIDYALYQRPEQALLEKENVPDFLRTQNDVEELLRWYRSEV